MQEEATQLNNRVSLFNQAWRRRGLLLLPWTAQTQEENPPEPYIYILNHTRAGIQGLATSEILNLALAALSLGTIILLWDQEPVYLVLPEKAKVTVRLA